MFVRSRFFLFGVIVIVCLSVVGTACAQNTVKNYRPHTEVIPLPPAFLPEHTTIYEMNVTYQPAMVVEIPFCVRNPYGKKIINGTPAPEVTLEDLDDLTPEGYPKEIEILYPVNGYGIFHYKPQTKGIHRLELIVTQDEHYIGCIGNLDLRVM